MRLISWNVAARIKALPRQAEYVASRSPDLVALQEVTPNSAARWREALDDLGLVHVRVRAGAAGEPVFRQRGVLIASRFPLVPIPDREICAAWPEKAASVEVVASGGRFDLHAVYTPPGVSDRQAKIDVIEACCRALEDAAGVPRILVGDFNAPMIEMPDGGIATWGQSLRADGAFRVIDGPLRTEQDAAERRLMLGLPARGLRDLYRSLNGYDGGYSWTIKNRGRWITPRRFDHAFASDRIQASRCAYDHAPRRASLSDHAPLELDFDLPQVRPSR